MRTVASYLPAGSFEEVYRQTRRAATAARAQGLKQMDSRANTLTRLSVIPVLIALIFNLVIPVLAAAVPEVAPQALQPQVAEAADAPDQVTFTLEGCNLNTGTFIEASLTCTDPGYTTGNLGKLWAELDRVPHRLTAENNGANQTYEIKISADHLNDGTIGYDIISVPTLKSGSCTFTVSDQFIDAGQAGGADTTISRTLTITQLSDTTCVFDYNMRLALGSSGYSGSSLHAYLLAEGVGEKRVPLPVDKDFPAQELRKTMTAVQGQAYTWDVTKSSDPLSLDFPNTCATTPGARSATVDVTVSWTRSGPTASGSTVITTQVFANNPSERTINVAVSDVIYAGTDQSTPIDTASAAATAVPANTELLLLTHSFEYTGTATQFNDVATATYTDPVNPDVQIPGNTTATATATAAPAGGTPANATAIITDTESITGDGLAFSVAAPSIGAFTGGYVAGASTIGPVGWAHTASGSGSVTFTKTVSVDEPRITSGTLTDTATVTSADGQETLDTSAPLEIDITSSASVSLQINKTIPAGSLRNGESVTFDFDVTAAGFSDDASITFNFGDPLSKSTTLTGLAPGTYTVHEVPQANWADHTDQVATITLPDCAGSVSFNNNTLAPALSILKTADNATVTAGDPIGFAIELQNSSATGTGVAKDATLDDALPFGDGVDWEIDSVTGIGGFDPTGLCSIVGSPPDEDLDCDLGDLAPGEGVRVELSSDTTGDSCGEYPNTAKAKASNHDEITWSASTEVLCPDLEISKSTTTPEITAGEAASYTVTISNEAGDAPATGVDLVDTLPGGVTWTEDSADCSISDAGVLSCPDLTIPAGEAFSVTVMGTTDEGECPSILNRASFTSDNAGSGESHPEGQGVTITVNCPDLEVTKEQVDENGASTTEPVDAGDTAYFAIHVTNHGPGTAFDVDVLDFAPDGTVWTVVDDGGFTCPATIDDAGDSCTVASMAIGSGTIILSYETTEADCGLLENNVEVSASNEPSASVGLDNEAQATITVECPGLNIIKRQVDDNGDPTDEPILAGETAYFEILVWNSDDEGIGTAHDVVVTEDDEDLPDGVSWSIDAPDGVTCASSVSTEAGQSFSCELGDLEPGDEVSILVSGLTDRADCGALVNTARVDASNNDDEVPPATATILVSCPEIDLDKENDAVGSVLPGTTVEYTLTLTVSDEGLENGEATDVVVVDKLPIGIEDPALISDGGVYDAATHRITWDLGDLGEGTYELTYQSTVADDVENGEELVNAAEATSPNSQCPDSENVQPECEDESTVTPRVPTLIIDKLADAEVITISGPNDALVADPSVVTWTLSYTLTNGPVTNAVITDEIPVGFEFLDASDGAELIDGVVTWTFLTLTESGSVTFRTTVDPETISRTGPTVNTAVIDSDETAPDDGEDSVTVVVEPPPLGGNPPKEPTVPDTAVIPGPNGEPITVPVELLAVVFLGSLGAVALANVRARSRRR